MIGLLRTARRRGTAIYSYRQLADKLGFRSPRTLAMVHKGQRKPSRMLVDRIISRFDLDPIQSQFITLLAERSAVDDERIARLREALRKLSSLKLDESNALRDSLCLTPDELSYFKRQLRLFIVDQRFRYESSESAEKLEFVIEISFSNVRAPGE